MIKAVIFDMDGLLIDSEPAWTQTDRQLLGSYGKDYLPEDKSRFMGSGVKEFVRFLKKRFSLSEGEDKLLAERMQIFKALILNDLKLRPGARGLLEELRKRGYLLALATGNNHEMMDLILNELDLGKYFSARTSSDEVPHGKPAPDVFLESAKRLRIEPSECLVLEDAVNGVLAAKAAGMKAIAVCDQRYNRPELFTEADMVVGGLGEVTPELIAQFF